MLGKFLTASAALVLGTTAAMTAQANYYAQPMVQQPMMAQPAVAQPMVMAQPTVVAQPMVMAQPTVVADSAKRSVDQMMTQCGIGGMLVGKTSPAMASLTNITTWSGTSASLTGSLAPDTCHTPQYRAAFFIKESINDLEVDLAVGTGKHLQALNSVIGCQAVSESLRNEYAEYVHSAEYTMSTQEIKAQKLFDIVDAKLSSSVCSA